jgi:hypothetical protein
MTERLKFRFWDKTLGGYILGAYIQIDMNGSLWYRDEETERCINVTDKFIVEQSTDLKDKAGNLIYEGDLLKFPKGIIAEILWVDDEIRFGISDNYEGYVHEYTAKWNFAKAEIIGNIHETNTDKE